MTTFRDHAKRLRREQASKPSRGFTLVDLMVTISVVAVVAAVVAPSMSDEGQLRLMAAAKIVRSDIELAQVMNISFPDDPVVVRFDTANRCYWLALAASPDTPIDREDNGRPYLVTMGQGRASSAGNVSIAIADAASDTITFNALGGVADMVSEPQVTLSLSGQWIRLDLASTTGTITESSGP